MSDRIEFRPIDRSQHEVLVVDDDPVSRYATARLLRNAGFRVREAADGREGLALADDTISAIVLDVHLPDIDGFALSRQLRLQPHTARLPVMHLSAAYVTDEDKVRGLDAGADAYLTHPVEAAVIVATVQALVRTRMAEEAMRRSEAKFRAIYAQAPAGIALLDQEARIIEANPALLRLLGRSLDEVNGHRVIEFIAPDWAARLVQQQRPLDLIASNREIPLVDPAGNLVHVEWSLARHVEPGVSMAVVTDISQQVLLAQQRRLLLDAERVARSSAERMNRMKDDFIAVLSHELRAPLNAIMGWTHVMQKRGGSTEEQVRGLAAIERNGKMQARMISDMLDMSRLNVGKMPLSLEPIDVAEVVAQAVNAMRPSIEENEQQVVMNLDQPSRPLHADSSRLQQIVWNLVSNAIKFSPRGGRIEVTLREADDGVTIAVADNGRGIEPHFLPLLFERFTQGEALRDRHRAGLGLGLSIVRQLAEAHGGSANATSAGLGRGAVVSVWLPFDGASGRASSADDPGSDPRTVDGIEDHAHLLDGVRILVVDDDPEACAMLQIILSDRGATVNAAPDYDSALQLREVLLPDIVVSDIGMPGKDGYELIREIRRREGSGDHVPAIALTSFNRAQDRMQAVDAGFDAHSAKPLRPLQLIQEIRRLLSARRRARA